MNPAPSVPPALPEGRQRAGRLLPVLLLGAFLALAVAYSLAVPIFEGPDEDDHFRYARFLADQRALPVQLFQAGGGAAGHQGWQPPLYYALAALVISQVDTADFEKHLWRNPAASFQGDPACCGRNFYFHTDSENFPYTGTTLAVHLARGVSILFGLLTVAGIYALVLTLFPQQHWLALATAAFAGFNPGFLFASSLVSNDAPLAAFCSLTLLVCAQLLMQRRLPTGRNFVLLGVLVALAVLVKSTALGLIPLALATGAVIAWRSRSITIFWNALTGVLAPCALLTGWWFVRNQILYGDPLAYRLIAVSAILPRDQPLTWAELFHINLPWMWQTFWGGPTPGDFSALLLVALAALTSIAALGAVLFLVRTTDHGLRVTLALLASWLGFILLAQIRFIRTSGGTDQGRYLFPAIASFAVLWVLGLREILARVGGKNSPIGTYSHTSTPAIVLTAAATALALFVLCAYTLPAYARPPRLDAAILARADQELDANFSNQLALRGYSLSTRRLRPGDTLQVTLFWQGLATMRDSYRVFAHLLDKQGRVAGGKDVIPFHGAYPTVLWKPGEWVQDTIALTVATDAVPSEYQVEVGLYPFGQPDNRLNLAHSEDDRVLLDAIDITR